MSKRRGEQTSLVQTYHRRGSGRRRWVIFGIFLQKKSYFNAIWITFRTFLEPFKMTKSLRIESQLKQSSWLVFYLLTDQVPITFKILNLGVKFSK